MHFHFKIYHDYFQYEIKIIPYYYLSQLRKIHLLQIEYLRKYPHIYLISLIFD